MNMKNEAAAGAGVGPPLENLSDRVEEQDQDQESGWTDYLEDYFMSEFGKGNNLSRSSIGSCSWHNISNSNAKNHDINSEEIILDDDIVPKKLTFKQTRTQKIFQDDSLEDTATSPIQSPKVADLKVKTSHVNPRFDDQITMISSSTGSGRILRNYYSKTTEKVVYSSAELKKKGLCLFPLSMLLNYHHDSAEYNFEM